MSSDDTSLERKKCVREYLGRFFGCGPVGSPSEPVLPAHATLTRRNQPEFHADAPWRLEVDQDSIPLLFLIRDANLQKPARGPWLIERLYVDQELANGQTRTILDRSALELPCVAPDGSLVSGFWLYRARIALSDLAEVRSEQWGETVRLRVTFEGRFQTSQRAGSHTVCRYLEVRLAQQPLPLRAVPNGSEGRCWFYGDTHYHSAYTNDIWEFGNPVRDARDAGIAIGLDWLIITDHSCDLDEADGANGALTRWERLRHELSQRSVSDHRFRSILGEEITVRKGEFSYMHMLAIGGLEHLIEGGFWSDADDAVKGVVENLMALLVKVGGYPQDTVERLFDKVHTVEDALALLPPQTLVFAAHPQTAAQPPFVDGTWDVAQLALPRLTGYEFWNGRARRQTKLLAKPTADPFSGSAWNDADRSVKTDGSRIKKLRQWAQEQWDPVLQRGVDEWTSPTKLPAERPVFIGGSDAHGDFNYSVGVGWDYQQHRLISDNALGKVRTAIYLPTYRSARVPSKQQILRALKKGSCVVTDGPILELSLQQNGNIAQIGDVLTAGAGNQTEATILLHTTPEFGAAREIELTCYAVSDDGSGKEAAITAKVEASTAVMLKGNRGYCRALVQTTGPGRERFCCFTNPVWFWAVDCQTVPLDIRVAQQGL